jgi:hypothetical protein
LILLPTVVLLIPYWSFASWPFLFLSELLLFLHDLCTEYDDPFSFNITHIIVCSRNALVCAIILHILEKGGLTWAGRSPWPACVGPLQLPAKDKYEFVNI